MQNKIYPSNEEIAYQALNQRRHQDNPLFSETKLSPYWKLSDLAFLYPNFFNAKQPVSQPTKDKIKETVLNSCVPEFHTLTPEPIHVLDIKDTYNFYINDTNEIKTAKNSKNQKLSPVACEYLFRQFKGAEFEQAYFLYPEKDIEELKLASQELAFERIRDQVAKCSDVLSAIINRSKGANKRSFSEVWSTLWRVLYQVPNMDELRDRFNLTSSPLDYMKPQTLVYMNGLLQNIIMHFCDRTYLHVNEIKDYTASIASFARANFIRYGSTPEEQLLEKSSCRRIEKIRNARKEFWKKYYPISLQQR